MKKRELYHEKVKFEKKKSDLDIFLNKLKNVIGDEISVKKSAFPKDIIAEPNQYTLPKYPKHIMLRCKSDEEMEIVQNVYLEWINNQKEEILNYTLFEPQKNQKYTKEVHKSFLNFSFVLIFCDLLCLCGSINC